MGELMTGPEALLHFGESITALLGMLALCTTRMYVAFMVMPPMANQAFTGPMKNGACLLLGFFIAWGQSAHMLDHTNTTMLLMLLGKEAIIGLMMGFAFSIVFWIAEGVGAMIDNMAGYNNVQQTNPQSGEQSTPVSNLLSQLIVSGFFMLDGMLVCVALLLQSFQWWPMVSLVPDLAGGMETFISFQMYGYLSSVAKVAAPIMLVLVLIDLSIGLISRTADKLEPNNLGQPIKGAVATLMLALLVSAYFDEARPMIGLRNLESQLRTWAEGGALEH